MPNSLDHNKLNSSQRVLGDLSNTSSTVFPEKMNSDVEMESPVKKDDNTSRTYVEIRELIDPILLTKICEAVHHDKNTNSLEDEIEEVVDEVLTQFYPKEFVHFKQQGASQWGSIVSTEKRGAMRFYYLSVDGTKLPNKIDGSTIRRKYHPSEKDIRILLEHITEKEPGKPWSIKEDIRKEFNIKDKFAAIFCNTPKTRKSFPTTTGRENEVASSSEDENPTETRRLSGIPPTKTSKKTATPKEVKPKGRPKKEENGEEKDKKEKRPRKQKEKTENGRGGMKKFVKNETHGESAAPFMSVQKRGERKINSVVTKLADNWKKLDYSEFLKTVAWGAKILNGAQIDMITNDYFRMALKRVFDDVKDKQQLKKLKTKEKKKQYRQEVINKKKAKYKIFDTKIKEHFSGKVVVEDLTLDDTPLTCPGHPITLLDNRSVFFPDCLMITQFLSSLRQFIVVEEPITAVSLCNGIHEGRAGYYKYTVKVLVPLLKALIQDVEYKLHTHFDARLHEFNIHEVNISEICRALLIGKTKKDKKPKLNKQNQNGFDETDEDEDEEDEKESVKDGSTKDDSVKDESVKDEEAKEDKKVKEDEIEDNDSKMDNEEKEDEMKDEKEIVFVKREVGETERLLSFFTQNHEFWQLSPAIQMDLLKHICDRIMELESCRDFLTEDTISDEAVNIKERAQKLQQQVNGWKETLSNMPEIDENVDESMLSRQQTRERTEITRKRDNLEKKIDDNQDKLDELWEQYATEKMLQAQSKRLAAIGFDRHCRAYYLVPQKTPDGGIWIQDFGTTNFEKFVKECVANNETMDEQLDSVQRTIMKQCMDENIYDQENWFRVEDLGAFNDFIGKLGKGVRELQLKKFLTNNSDLIAKVIRQGSKNRSKSLSPPEGEDGQQNGQKEMVWNISENPLDYLKTSVLELYSDLRDGYLTTLDPTVFEPKVISCETLDAVKDSILEMVNTVKESSIQVKLAYKEARETGCYSWFVLDKWKARLIMAQNASAVHLLLTYFESRIDWSNSVKEKRCSVCNSKRSAECKISCQGCGLVCHYYCCRPKLHEKPSTWSCTACTRQDALQARAAKSRKPKYVESETEDEQDEEEEEEEQSDEEKEHDGEEEEEGVADEEVDNEQTREENSLNSDVFTAESDDDTPINKPLPKKRPLVEFDQDDEEEENNQKRRTRASLQAKKPKRIINENVLNCWEKLKGAHRMYRTLQNIPTPRQSRRTAAITLSFIEENLAEYEDFDAFADDFRIYLDGARDYLEHHNERKLDELDELILSMNLPETS